MNAQDSPQVARDAGILRRLFRFRLWTLLLAVTVLPAAIGLLLKVNTARRQRNAVAAIQKYGGAVWYDYEHDPDGPSISRYAPNQPRTAAGPVGYPWLRARLGDDYFRTVIRVDLVESGISDSQLGQLSNHLKSISPLEAVVLDEPKITDAGIAHLAELDDLAYLRLYGFPLGNEGLKHVGELTGLRELELMWTEVNDDGLKHLANLKQLETLYIWSGMMTDDGLEELAKLPKLKRLSLQDAQISDAGLEHVTRFPVLESLSIRGSQVTPSGVESLKEATPDLRVRVR